MSIMIFITYFKKCINKKTAIQSKNKIFPIIWKKSAEAKRQSRATRCKRRKR